MSTWSDLWSGLVGSNKIKSTLDPTQQAIYGRFADLLLGPQTTDPTTGKQTRSGGYFSLPGMNDIESGAHAAFLKLANNIASGRTNQINRINEDLGQGGFLMQAPGVRGSLLSGVEDQAQQELNSGLANITATEQSQKASRDFNFLNLAMGLMGTPTQQVVHTQGLLDYALPIAQAYVGAGGKFGMG